MLVLTAVLALVAADTSRAEAQQPEPVSWSAAAFYELEAFEDADPSWSSWQTAGARVRRRSTWGAAILEAASVRRFDRRDVAIAAEAYPRLWDGAWAYARVQAAPGADVLPDVDAAVELFQGLGGGWEASGGLRLMSFPEESVEIWSGSLARYVGSWYVRGKGSLVPAETRTGSSFSLLARRYGAEPDTYVEGSAGFGEEVVTVAPGPVQALRDQRFVAVRLERYLGERFGVLAGASWTSFEGIPDRVGGTAGVLIRW